ncbi:glycosyltransferase family 92 protein F13G3.3 [Anguilla anguilla]|uniref:glycosyltransferase family 92 protein F13G3.3 n=1 Tax=Anguilla anguilla TaxID=7936 RepID=UPI0015A984B7|nr:glycosyltransferase family 92 protein F13G3.3 [Anguilla anguilla]
MASPSPDQDTPTRRPNWKYIAVLIVFFIVNIAVYSLTSNPTKGLKQPMPRPASHLEPLPTAPGFCPFPAQRDPLVSVSGARSYVVAPYVEHRGGGRQIRAISIVYRPEPDNYQCLLCCGGRNFSVSASRNVHSDHFGFDYCAGDIFCPVASGCAEPEHVAIFSRGQHQEPAFFPVQNRELRTGGFKYNFTVCISTMYGNYSNLLQVVQSMEMYRLLGVGRVAVYKNSCSPEVERALDYYEAQGLVEVVPWPVTSFINVSPGWRKSASPGDLHYYGQIPALNDCLYRYMYRTKYVALHDIDELILPQRVDDWNQLLVRLEQRYSADRGFEFENHVFPVSVSDQIDKYRPREWEKVKGVNVLEHVFREPNIPNRFNNFKVIANPRLVFETTVHGFLRSMHGTVRVDRDEAHLYHVKKGARPELSPSDLIRDDRVRHYAPRLVPAVSKALKHISNSVE